VIDQCQREMKIFKIKKYKDGYENIKRGAAPKYPLEVEAFLASHGIGGALAHGSHAAETRAFPRALSSDVAFPVTGLPTNDYPTARTSDRDAIKGGSYNFLLRGLKEGQSECLRVFSILSLYNSNLTLFLKEQTKSFSTV